jgi:hypothetical protein
MGEMVAAGKSTECDLLNFCVWVKSNGGMVSFYRSRHELDDRFHKTDHNSTFVESDQARISQGHLTTSVPANIRFEPRKRPTSFRIQARQRSTPK